MKFYILVEDNPDSEHVFSAEHGLSVYFEDENLKFLLDTGKSGMFMDNAKQLDLKLSDTDYIVLSHGHYDHTGGLAFFKIPDKAQVIAHPDFSYPKYESERYLGMPNVDIKDKLVLSKDVLKISSNVYFLGEIPGYKKPLIGKNGEFDEYIIDGKRKPDFLKEDSALVVINDNRIIIISGCAHSGIVNIVKYAQGLFSKKEIIVIGGFHMLKHSDSEIKSVINDLKKMNVSSVYPGHCTGRRAVDLLLENFKGEKLYSGKIIEV